LISRELFAHYVRDALVSYHDPARLQVHPLIDLLRLKSLAATSSGAALKQLLRDTIEQLRPGMSVDAARPEWTSYRLLVLRYLRAYSPQLVCEELGFSLASFYRHHQDALEALASLLWEHYVQQRSMPQVASRLMEGSGQDKMASEEATRIARESYRQSLDLCSILEAALEIVSALAAKRGLVLSLDCSPALPKILGDPAILRQAVLNILTEAIELSRGNTLELVAVAQGKQILCQVGELALTGPEEIEQMAGLGVSRALLGVYGGSIGPANREGALWGIAFTLAKGLTQDVLIVDDDADTIRLYSRFLEAHGFGARAARSMDQLKTQLAESLPDIVLLDVLMPREDGWDMLAFLKREPETAHLPVILCSVLDQPDLALSLGAAEVLRKPIQEEMLIRTMQSVLLRAGSGEPGHRESPADSAHRGPYPAADDGG